MNELEYENRQKAITARSARNVKRGSRSKKVTLPHDHMTNAEWKRRNGTVNNYNLSRPMRYSTFREMPQDLQKEYLRSLIAKYHANRQAIADMMGIHTTTVACVAKELNIHFPVGGAGKMTEADRKLWETFLDPKPIAAEPVAAEPVAAEPVAAEPKKKQPITVIPSSGSVTFIGTANAAMERMAEMLGGLECRITISWETSEIMRGE